MSSTNFEQFKTPINADWLNEVNAATFSGSAVYTPAGTGAVATTVQVKLRESPSRSDYGSDADYNTAISALSGRSDKVIRVSGGTSDRLLSEKLSEVISVFDFMTAAQISDVKSGAATLDVTASIQAALDTGAAQVFFPAGRYKTTSTIRISAFQTLMGVAESNQSDGISTLHSSIYFRPSASDLVAIKNKVSASGCSIRDMAIDLNANTHYGVQFSTTYGNVIDGLTFIGTYAIGILLQDTYVCDIHRVNMLGVSVKKYGIYIGASNSIQINRLHTSMLPNDNAVAMTGIALYGSCSGLTIIDSLFQGPTIGIDLGNSSNRTINIINPYFENCLLNIRVGNAAASSGVNGLSITGGTFSVAYPSHPQYASRGPVIWLRAGVAHSIGGAHFLDSPAPANANGPWPILIGTATNSVTVTPCSQFGSGVLKDLVMREVAGASPSLNIIGSTYGTFGATELILKKDGAYGGTCYGLRIDNAGTVSTVAYAPTLITGTVNALLTTEIPAPATLLL